jgi:hypothetical protein
MNPIKEGKNKFKINKNNEAFSAASAVPPILVKKKTAAPSLIPRSPILICGIKDFENITIHATIEHNTKLTFNENAENKRAN